MRKNVFRAVSMAYAAIYPFIMSIPALPKGTVGLFGLCLVLLGIMLWGYKGGVVSAVYASIIIGILHLLRPDITASAIITGIIVYFVLGLGGGKTLETIRSQRDKLAQEIQEHRLTENALRESEERHRRLVELSPDAIFIYSDGEIMFFNHQGSVLLGIESVEQVIGKNLIEFIHPDCRERIENVIGQRLENKHILPPTEGKVVRMDGQVVNVEATAAWISYHDKPSVMIIFRDITGRKLAEQRLHEVNQILHRHAMVDGLTEIGNRRYFDEVLANEWNRCERHSKSLSLVMLDIDFFKAYNDTYGHQGGDQCLKIVAKTLEGIIKRPGDAAARYGGEEFAFILPDTDADGVFHVAETARKAIESLKIPHVQSKISYWVTVSLGVASVIPSQFSDFKLLIIQADKALYKAKQEGRNRVVAYSTDYDE